MKYFLSVGIALFGINSAFAGNTGAAIAPPKYIGYITEKGDMGWNSKPGYKNKGLTPPLLAHKLCKEAFLQYPGARAAEYDDFKHIYPELDSGTYEVLDPILALLGEPYNGNALLKTGQIEYSRGTDLTKHFCQNYTDSTSEVSTYWTTTLSTATGKLGKTGCNVDRKIACVKD